MDDDVFDFDEVENQRKKKLNGLLKNLAIKRMEINKKFEKELGEQHLLFQGFTKDSVSSDTNRFSAKETKVSQKKVESPVKSPVDRQHSHVKDPFTVGKITMEESKRFNDNYIFSSQISDISTNYSVLNSFSNEDEFNAKPLKVNVPVTKIFLFKHVFLPRYTEIEKSIFNEKEIINKKELLSIKIEVNKRLNQVSKDVHMIRNLANLLKPYSNKFIFIEVFSLKMLEQCVIQISRHFESFKSYSYLFYLLYSDDLFLFYKFNLFTKEINVNTLKGLYSVYFGILELRENYTEVWNFVAGLLNSDCNEFSYVVLEVFLEILGQYINRNCRIGMVKLIKYIKKYIIQNIENQPQKYRIEELLKKLS